MTSIFISLLRGSSDDRSHLKLNSTRNSPIPPKGTGLSVAGLEDFDLSFIPRKQTLPYTRALTGATFSTKIPYLEDITKQNILEWQTQFLNAARVCNWPEAHIADYLLALTNIEYQSMLDNCQNYLEMLAKLTSKKYPRTKASYYEQKLLTIKQEDYHDLEDYVIALDATLIRWKATTNATAEEAAAKRNQSFMNGLAIETLNFIDLHNLINLQEVYNRITETEVRIRNRMEESEKAETNNYQKNFKNERNDGNKYNHSIRGRYSTSRTPHRYHLNGYYRHPNGNNHRPNFQRPYCSYHKYYGHKTEDCRTKQYKDTASKTKEHLTNRRGSDSNNKNNGPERTNAIKEKPKNVELLELELKVNNKRVIGLVDTGSKRSFINRNYVLQNSLRLQETEQREFILANGHIERSDKVCNLKFQFNKQTKRTFEHPFFILQGCSPEIILGLQFLADNDFYLNFKTGTFGFNNIYTQIKSKEVEDDDEGTLIEKLNLNTIKESKSELEIKVSKLIDYYKTQNPLHGHIEIFPHEIKLSDNTPFIHAGYNIPLPKLEITRAEICRLERLEFIRPSKSQFVSAAFPIYKRNGSVRLVIDYRTLNKRTVPLRFPLPSIQTLLSQISNSSIFSQVDLNRGFYQIGMDKDSIEKTAFVFDNKTWEFLRMPFGLTNAPSTFQRSMCSLFAEFSFIKIYMDDILIHSSDIKSHLQHLQKFFEIANKANLSINFEKSKFACPQVRYLGRLIDKNGYRADPSRTDALLNFQPRNKGDLRKVLGIIQWFRPYLPKLSLRTHFISKMLQKNSTFSWNEKKALLLNKIVDEIKTGIQLNFLDPNSPYALEVDASPIGGGGVLTQKDKVIALYSTKWNVSELNYSITEKEILIIYKCIQKFQDIVFDSPLLIYTDSKNAIATKDLSRRSQRWLMNLETFDYQIKHKPAKDNSAADTLSRLCVMEEVGRFNLPLDDIIRAQNGCPYVAKLQKSNATLNKNIHNQRVIFDKKQRLIIPDSLAKFFILKIHKEFQHPGMNSLYQTLFRFYNIQYLKSRLSRITSSCNICQESKLFRSNLGTMKVNLYSNNPFELISSDILGPLALEHFTSNIEGRYFYILTISDLFS